MILDYILLVGAPLGARLFSFLWFFPYAVCFDKINFPANVVLPVHIARHTGDKRKILQPRHIPYVSKVEMKDLLHLLHLRDRQLAPLIQHPQLRHPLMERLYHMSHQMTHRTAPTATTTHALRLERSMIPIGSSLTSTALMRLSQV
jgi:hypothetical protein